MKHNNIEAVFTDFGGVLLHLEFERCFNAFRRLGVEAPEDVLFRTPAFAQAMRRLETGEMEGEAFFKTLRDMLRIEAEEAEIGRAWNLIIGDIPRYKLDALRHIRRHCRLYMVSNTNAPHFDHTRQTLFRDEGLTVDDYFDKLYLSHEIHALKPDADFYEKVLQDSGEDPSKSLFLDDLAPNIEGARRAGFRTCLIDPEEDLGKKIAELLA